MDTLPKRKKNRLEGYDYTQPNYYFVTVCVQDREPILSRIVGGDALIAPRSVLTPIGTVVEKHIQKINTVYADVAVERYIIMPNHIHLLLLIDRFDVGTMRASSPTNLSTVIRSLKTFVTKEIGQNIWQRSFYDEIIKNETHFQRAWDYIEYNALKEYAENEKGNKTKIKGI
ncbi:MAG: transposase [Candidatus Fimenecus sp.]